MAQTQTVTNTGIEELVLLWEGAASSKMESIVALNDSDSCVAAVASTFADPAEAATHHTDGALDLASIDTVSHATTNTAGDTLTFDHVFTASATRNVVGIHACNDDDTVAYVECCFNALIAMENSDTLTIDGEVVIDQA